MKDKQEKTGACPGCGALFVCGVEAGQSSCWCMETPIGLSVPEAGSRCYCPACLDKRISELQNGAFACASATPDNAR